MKKEQKISESILHFELTSDLFFSVALEDIEVCQEEVQILLNRPIQILDVKCQYTILNLTHHSIRIDILAREVDGKTISLEMHPQSDEDRVKRTRYNVGSIDVQSLKIGKEYRDLPDVIHIYITKSDFLKTEKGINYVSRTVKGTDVEIPNGVEEYYISLSRDGDNPEQTALLKYMLHSKGIKESNIFPKLVERVNYLKTEQGGHTIMCEIMDQLLREEREEVLAEVQAKIDKANEELDKTNDKLDKTGIELNKVKAELDKAQMESEAKGIAETLLELDFSPEEVIKKLIEKLNIKELEARKYLVI